MCAFDPKVRLILKLSISPWRKSIAFGVKKGHFTAAEHFKNGALTSALLWE